MMIKKVFGESKEEDAKKFLLHARKYDEDKGLTDRFND